MMDSRSSTEGTFVGVFTNGRKRIRDDGDEEVYQPEVQYDNAYDEEKAGDEKFRVHHLVHYGRPL